MERRILARVGRTALITSPVIGLLAVTPVLLFGEPPALPAGSPVGGFESFNAIMGFLLITVATLLMWGLNCIVFIVFRFLPLQVTSRKWTRYALSYLLILLVIAAAIVTDYGGYPHNSGHFRFSPFLAGVTNNTIILIIFDLILLQDRKSQVEWENSRLMLKYVQAEQELLKQQLNPHFLFNSLSALHGLIRTDTTGAEEYLLHLSDFLRLSIHQNDTHKHQLNKELDLAFDYLRMQQVRFREALLYEINVDEAYRKRFVPVFAVQVLLENAIKHNAFTRSRPLLIRIRSGQDSLIVENTLIPRKTPPESFGKGLKNLSERYELLSGKTLHTEIRKNLFVVTIPLLKHENHHY